MHKIALLICTHIGGNDQNEKMRLNAFLHNVVPCYSDSIL